jgi:pyruvate, water dikinase
LQIVHSLNEIQSESVNLHGGKAVNLARLRNFGFRVPQGIVISSAAFEQMERKNKDLASCLRKVDETEDFEEILEISGIIQSIISSYTIPKEIVSEITKRINSLEQTELGFAIRSSATIEDRSDISFAGQAESYLCVKEQDNIIESVKKVWQSAFSERALFYLKTRGIPLEEVKMAVLIQEMIPAEISGVMFTANVVTNSTDEILINSTWGIGDTLVAGEIVPDTFVLTKNPFKIIQRTLGDKEFTSDAHIYDLIRTGTPEEKRSQFTLNDKTLHDLAEVGMKIEMSMESPQDIEWCIRSDGRLVILQSRPITTLSGPSSHEV